jgi:integrase
VSVPRFSVSLSLQFSFQKHEFEINKFGRTRQLRAQNLQPAAAGMDGLTPHSLRHTAASLAISAGAHVKSVQSLLGHASAA